MNTYFDSTFGLSGDRWEEGYDFVLRLFGFSAGALADAMLGDLAGGFMEDLTDIYDLYMMTFQKVELMKEGKPHVYMGTWTWSLNFDDIVSVALVFSYITLFARLFLGNFAVKLGSKDSCVGRMFLCKVKVGVIGGLFLSLIQ